MNELVLGRKAQTHSWKLEKGGKEVWEWRCDRQWTRCVVLVEAASETVGCLLEDESGKG